MKWIKKKGTFGGKQYRDDVSKNFVGSLVCVFNIIVAIFLLAHVMPFIIDWRDTLAGKTLFLCEFARHFPVSMFFALYLLVVFPLSFIVKNHRTFRGLTVIFHHLQNLIII